MLHGLYSSAQGALLQSRRLAVVSNNIANAGTTAFKRDLPIEHTLPQFNELMNRPEELPHGLENQHGATALHEVFTDFSDGPLQPTGQPLDIALRGPGFLRVADPQENEFLTRDGSLTVTADGTLVTTDQNLAVLDPQGLAIEIPDNATQLAVGSGGIISDLRLGPIAEIGIVQPVLPDGMQPRKLGNSLYEPSEEFAAADPQRTRVISGHLEVSGVEPTAEMVEMVQTTRAFELNMTMMQTQDGTLSHLLDAAARI